MNLHDVIAKVEGLGIELEHAIATDARKAWELLKAELEKLRGHADATTGVIEVDAEGAVVPPTHAVEAAMKAPTPAPEPAATAAPEPAAAPEAAAPAAEPTPAA